MLSKTPVEGFSLPLTATDKNRHRLDPWDAIALCHVFRDPWERRIPIQKPPERDVRSAGDYPELQDLFEQINEAINKVETLGENVASSLEDSAEATVVEEQPMEPAKPDRLWIYRHGGHLGEPLGSKRLPWIGPPKDDGRAEALPNRNDDDEHSDDDSFAHGYLTPSPFAQGYRTPSPLAQGYRTPSPLAQGYRTPSPFGYDSDHVRADDEPLPKETPMGERLDQEANTTGQNSSTNSKKRRRSIGD